MDFFNYKTRMCNILMGHNTFNSYGGKSKIIVVNSIEDIKYVIKNSDYRDIYISGGKKIYELCFH